MNGNKQVYFDFCSTHTTTMKLYLRPTNPHKLGIGEKFSCRFKGVLIKGFKKEA